MNKAERAALAEAGGRCQCPGWCGRHERKRCGQFFGQGSLIGNPVTPVFRSKGHTARGSKVALCPECAATFSPPPPPGKKDNFSSDGVRAFAEAMEDADDDPLG